MLNKIRLVAKANEMRPIDVTNNLALLQRTVTAGVIKLIERRNAVNVKSQRAAISVKSPSDRSSGGMERDAEQGKDSAPDEDKSSKLAKKSSKSKLSFQYVTAYTPDVHVPKSFKKVADNAVVDDDDGFDNSKRQRQQHFYNVFKLRNSKVREDRKMSETVWTEHILVILFDLENRCRMELNRIE